REKVSVAHFSASVKNTILYLNTLFFVEIIKIDKNSKKSLNFHRGICVGKTGVGVGFGQPGQLSGKRVYRQHSLQLIKAQRL
ncbi:hypothetical protein KW475_06545, partial [Vibrio fluvialis]|nr:hypothetical protein [Vibrio fluvialis]